MGWELLRARTEFFFGYGFAMRLATEALGNLCGVLQLEL